MSIAFPAPAAPSLFHDFKIEPRLMATALALAILAAATLALASVDGRTIGGVNVWIKPLKFQISLAVHLGTLALLWRWLPERIQVGRTGRVLSAVLIASTLYEIVYIGFRGARGEMSHFNHTSPLADALYSLMGLGATAIVAATALMGFFVLFGRDMEISAKPMRRAVGSGLLISGIMGGATGWVIAVRDGAMIGASDAVVPFFGWLLEAGDLRIAHFMALHAMQGLPLIGLLARRMDVAIVAAGLWIAATMTLLIRALNGQGFI